MEHVSITNSLQLQQFRQRLCESDQLSGRPIGHMVRTLTMEGLGSDADDTEVWDDRSMDAISTVLSILLQVPCLQQYTLIEGWTTSQADLLCLATIATNLTSLNVKLDPEIDGFVPVLNKLRNLHRLFLQFNNSEWRQSTEPPIRLPAVTHFSWTSYEDAEDMLTLLSGTRLAQECHMVLEIGGVEPDDMAILQPLFDSHRILTLQVALDNESMSLLVREIMRVPKVTFFGVVPQLFLWANQVLPSEIVIQLHYHDNGEKEEELFEVLSDLCMDSRLPLTHSTILKLQLPDRWEWDWLERNAGADHALFVGNLLPLAVPLYHRGIVVVDKNGRDVSCLTRRCSMPQARW
jgi:hypothetical protein